ncbi:PQQ-dependent sugar dehydrogenase [Pricia sp. S334]|uniref:PQQ-dependent sugar dehydrogenase n=1 Tax=Pricia mediterranea TaxID=3076079 RepID=A0ABU3L6C1_9FLAO|nr:c-type cytochrome [Pricia sp. S334]MDT7828642.1 PQQ-dependent sugar dehydrogenase [Pricia sp. S334]
MLNRFKLYMLVGLCSALITSCDRSVADGGLQLPVGFESSVVVDSISETARHLAVNTNGDIYVNFKSAGPEGSLAALRDKDNDGRADRMRKFGISSEDQKKWGYSTAARIYNGYLYFSTELVVYRYKLNPDTLVPEGKMETVLTDDHPHGSHEHIGKPLAFDDKGYMYVPFGAPSSACQEPKRTPGAPGLDPCPQLEDHGGIWRFDANKLNQTQKDGFKYATGIRSVVAMDWNSVDGELYVVMHGRDDLLRLWPDKYSPWESALLPSEEFMRVTEGSDFGWPYCYYDQIREEKVLAPEYGGDGEVIGRCADFENPFMGFPGHWAPNDLVFYTGDQFPNRYKNGAFVAFHGSTNRAPYPQSGYFVGFVPFEDGEAKGEWEVFADGFAEVDPIVNTKDAHHRPMGIAVGPDGSLYISDSVKGKIWKITYNGDTENFGKEELLVMEKRKQMSHIRTPDKEKDNLMPKNLVGGAQLYQKYCSACHQMNGRGASGRFPPLTNTDWVAGDKERLIKIVLNGMEGSLVIDGEVYNGVMPQHSFLSDREIAEVLTYIRSSFGNEASEVKMSEVQKVKLTQQESGGKIVPIKAEAEM